VTPGRAAVHPLHGHAQPPAEGGQRRAARTCLPGDHRDRPVTAPRAGPSCAGSAWTNRPCRPVRRARGWCTAVGPHARCWTCCAGA
jgi:hypothetical protein